jgi:hypothetical protein
MSHRRLLSFVLLLLLLATASALAAGPPASQISVQPSGSPGAAVFTVTGSGFVPRSQVFVFAGWVSAGGGAFTRTIPTTATAQGTISVVVPLPGLVSGRPVYFAAGPPQSNLVQVPAP